MSDPYTCDCERCREKKILPSAIVIAIVILSLSMLFIGCQHDESWPKQHRDIERIYDTSFGSVLCAQSCQSHCGVDLWQCHDGAEYKCLLNVRQRGD